MCYVVVCCVSVSRKDVKRAVEAKKKQAKRFCLFFMSGRLMSVRRWEKWEVHNVNVTLFAFCKCDKITKPQNHWLEVFGNSKTNLLVVIFYKNEWQVNGIYQLTCVVRKAWVLTNTPSRPQGNTTEHRTTERLIRFTHSLTHTHTHSLTHSLTHKLTQ